MALYKNSLLFDFTTTPTDATAASAHSGGWSETFWSPVLFDGSSWANIANNRAGFLATGVSVIGFRTEQFTISGNKLLPGGTSSGRLLKPGQLGVINLAQDALMMSGKGVGAVNTNHFSLRGIPDENIVQGEYSPTPAFANALATYTGMLTNGNFGFVGRVKTNPTARVQSIVAGVVTLSAAIGGINNVSYLRLLRVRDDGGRPVKGSFLITAGGGTNVLTLAGLGGVAVSTPNGLARIDDIAFFAYNPVTIQRAVSRKVGRPFEQYRGRASRRR